MKNRWLSCLLLASSCVFALDLPKNPNPIEFHADFVEVNNKTGVGHYAGHVRLQQGDTVITATKAESTRGTDHKIAIAIAYGDKTSQARLETRPKAGAELLVAIADKLTYHADTHQVFLEGNAVVTQADHRIKAPKIIYNISEDTVQFEHGTYSGKTTK